MKHRSIRLKFFAAISAVALVFIGVLLLLNLFFYQSYYMMTRRGELQDAYQHIQRAYSNDISTLSPLLDSYETRSAIRLSIVRTDGSILYSSAFSPSADRSNFSTPDRFQRPDISVAEQQYRSYAILTSIARNINWDTLQKHNYQILNVSLWNNDQYLCLVGVLNRNAGECLFAYMPYADIEQNSSLNLTFLLIAGGCALVICLICAFFVSRQFTQPLIAMAGLADRMSELDFSSKYDGKERNEIGQLGQSLNRMSAYLEQAIGELKQSNDQLALEIKEKERIDNMRREFIVNVSHELKTPIALIQGYAEGLTAGVADDPEDRKFYCDTIADEATHMNKLVMQLLNLSKLELGAEQTYCEDIDIYTLCKEAAAKTAVLCESRDLSIRYDDTHVTARTDSNLLEQVLMNYLSNAIRYTAPGGQIEITAMYTENGVRLTVFNEGEGLPEEELPKIWEKFYRTDHARTREAGGTGIGLSLVRAIADTLGADCGAQNTPGGISFWFTLPSSPPTNQNA